MYGIPEETDWSFALGKELIMVCVGQHQLVLRFHGDVVISIEGRFEHVSSGAVVKGESELPQRAASLMSLVGKTVGAIRAEDAKTLWIGFANGEALRIYDSSSNYEAFQITAPGVDIVV
jgi:hypothetical protein